jgi:thiamine monophosphate synthase
VLLFVTDPERPRERTLDVARLPGVTVLFRDKRGAWDRALLAELAGITSALIVNVGADSAAAAADYGALGWHAPEAVWRANPSRSGLVSLADHDGAGLVFAEAHAVPLVVVSPIWIDKGRAARGLEPFAAPSRALRVGLGGIETGLHASHLAAAGADGVAVQRALYAAARPAELAAALRAPFPTGISALLSR